MKNMDFARYVGNRMVEYGIEPTSEDFMGWVKESDVFTQERRIQVQKLCNQSIKLWDIVGTLAYYEQYSWWLHVDCMVEQFT